MDESAFAVDRGTPVTVQVHAHLRQQILWLKLRPGEALSEKELSVKLGVSRTPVREAFIKLSQEGLVDIFPQRGTLVAPIRITEIKEAQFLREILETAIVKRAASTIELAKLDDIDENLRRQDSSLARKDYVAFMELDEQFHHLLCQSVSLPRAWTVIHAVKGQLDRARFMGLPEPGHADLMFRQHSNIIKAVRIGDPEKAAGEMHAHLQEIWGSIERMAQANDEFFHHDMT